MNVTSLRKMLLDKQKELCEKLLFLLQEDPTPIYKLSQKIGIAQETLKDFLSMKDRSIGLKTLLKIEKWCTDREKYIRITKKLSKKSESEKLKVKSTKKSAKC